MTCWPFDLESVGDISCLDLLEPVKAPANYKSADAIAAYVAEKTIERNAKLALDPDANRIIALGFGNRVIVCPTYEEEAQALTEFWAAWEETRLPRTGYNVVGFDIPTLLSRSRILGVPHPRLKVTKYGCQGVVDLMLELHPNTPYKSMSFWCKRLKLQVPADATSGKDVAALWETGDTDSLDSIVTHCKIDLIKTRALYDRLFPEVEGTDVF